MTDLTANQETEPAVVEDPSDGFDAELLAAFEQQFGGPTPAVEADPEGGADPDATVVDETPETPAVEPERIIEPEATDDTLTLGDLTVGRAQAEAQLRWVQSLTPAQFARLEAPPVEEAAPAAGPPAPAAGAAPALPDLSVLKEVVPGLDDYLRHVGETQAQQADRLAAFQADQHRREAAEAQQQQSKVANDLAAAAQAFRTAHPELHPDDVTALEQAGARMQVFPALMREHGDDANAAYSHLLETAMWADPRFRDRMVQAAVDRHAEVDQEAEQRRQRAASLTGAGGSVSRTPPATPDTRGMSRQQTVDAMAAEIAQNLGQQ